MKKGWRSPWRRSVCSRKGSSCGSLHDGTNPQDYACSIKIDHHPFVEKFAPLEYIEEDASSTSQLIIKIILENKLKINSKITENLYIGIVSDTDRFLHDYTNKETIDLTNKLLELYNIDFTKLYEPLYSRPLSEVRFEGYIYENLIVNENKVAYIKITDDIIKKYGVGTYVAVKKEAAGQFERTVKYYELIKDDDIAEYLILKGSSEMNTKEFWHLLNGVVSECREQGIPTLEDDEIDRLERK